MLSPACCSKLRLTPGVKILAFSRDEFRGPRSDFVRQCQGLKLVTQCFHVSLQEEVKSVTSGDLGGHSIRLPLSVHHPRNFFSLPNSSVGVSHLRCTCVANLISINNATTCVLSCSEAILETRMVTYVSSQPIGDIL
ncbi:hypothetical protein TNCV_1875101 [Trichonephila clavipes]|nr:hypothetical protein TNCV_1875101 [Trichonephila clavipes]